MQILREDDNLKLHSPARGPTSLWWVLHVWGGVCLYSVDSVTGLSTALLYPLRGASHEAALGYASANVLAMVVVVTIGYKLSCGLVGHIDEFQTSRLKRNLVKSALPFLYFSLAVLLAMSIDFLFR